MVFDKEEQRQIILELLASATLPGKALDVLYVFKKQVLTATVKKENEGEK